MASTESYYFLRPLGQELPEALLDGSQGQSTEGFYSKTQPNKLPSYFSPHRNICMKHNRNTHIRAKQCNRPSYHTHTSVDSKKSLE